MPNKEEGSRHRMVVEEVSEVKPEAEVKVEEVKPTILDEAAKVSSQELLSNDNVQIVNNTEEVDKPESTPASPPTPVTPPSQSDTSVEKQKSPVAWILIPGIFLLGAILGGVVFYQKGINTINVTESPTPVATATPTATPTASPSAKVDVSKFDVAIYNGSGIAGEASKVKTLLEDAGFSVTSTGNASTYDYTKTIIKAKNTVDEAVLKTLKDALSKSYVVGDNQTLSTSSTTDIQVVVGSSKAE